MPDTPQNIPVELLEELYHFHRKFWKKQSLVKTLLQTFQMALFLFLGITLSILLFTVFLDTFSNDFFLGYLIVPVFFILLLLVILFLAHQYTKKRITHSPFFLAEYEQKFIAKVIPAIFPKLVYEPRAFRQHPSLWKSSRFNQNDVPYLVQPKKSFLLHGKVGKIGIELSRTIVMESMQDDISTAAFRGIFLCLKTNLSEQSLNEIFLGAEMQTALKEIDAYCQNKVRYTYTGEGTCIFDIYVNDNQLPFLDIPKTQIPLVASIQLVSEQLNIFLAPAFVVDKCSE